jgi:predicted TIM-barrel fold metal-dependent hydrolase
MDAIDCDVHCAPESYEALEPYLSDYWRQYIAEAGIRLTGLAHAYPRGAATSASPAAREAGSPAVPDGYAALAERVLSASAPAERFVVLNCLTGFEPHRNPYFSAAVATAINDWIREEFLARDDRLRASLVVSAVSTEDAVAEIERVGDDPRFVQVLLPVRSDVPWGHKSHHPIFAAASERSLRIGLHAWGRAGKAPTPSGFTTTYLEDYVGNQPIAQAQVLSLVSEGVFERFPDLRVVLIECGFAWLPPLLWRFDKDWKGVWREVPWLKRRPSEYVRDHFLATTAPAHLPDDAGAVDQVLEMMDGAGMLVYASDYPHEHGDGLSLLLGRLTDEQRHDVLWGTAARLYGLEAG